MAMQVHLPLVRLIPLCIEKKISRVTEFLDPLSVEVLSIGNSESMIVTDILIRQPVSNLILMVVFDVAMKNLTCPVDSRTASLLASLVEVSLSSCGGGKSFENK
jgi:hypothetical protein